jgi:hypothetical protein
MIGPSNCMMKKILLGLAGFLLLALNGCVNSFDPKLVLGSDLVVINGMVTDGAEPQSIQLSRSRSNRDSSNVSTPLGGATVEVIVNGTTPVSLLEVLPGEYRFPEGFRGKVGSSYQLRFRTNGGVTYESTVETMASSPPILQAYDQFNPEGPKKTANGLPIPANDIYIDFQDPAGERNFYLWRWRLYEMQVWCATCRRGRYRVVDVGPVGSGPINVLGCVLDQDLGVYSVLDYPCRGLCWDIFYNNDIDAFSDVYTNGKLQRGHKVASIPIYQTDPALIVIEQVALSASAYRYYQLFASQVQNTGTLADSPPAPLAGNVRNVDDESEKVIGYFSAGAVSVSRYKINRKNISGGIFQGLFYAQNNREPNLDSGSGSSSALCVPSRSRTDLIPEGW